MSKQYRGLVALVLVFLFVLSPVQISAEEAGSETYNETAETETYELTEESTEEPTEEPTKEPTEEPTEEPAEDTASESVLFMLWEVIRWLFGWICYGIEWVYTLCCCIINEETPREFPWCFHMPFAGDGGIFG